MARVKRSVIWTEPQTVAVAGINDIIFEVQQPMKLKVLCGFNETTASRVSIYLASDTEAGARACNLTAALSAAFWSGDLQVQPPQIITWDFVNCVIGDKIRAEMMFELEE